MSAFTDTNSRTWLVDIKFRHVDEIKRFCKGKDGKPLDLLAVLEKGAVESVFNDTETVVNMVFVLCYPEVRKYFNLAEYDAANAAYYEAVPELKAESEMFKAARWFAEQLDGQALLALGYALQEAIVNFCPSEGRKATLKKMLEKSRELDQMQAEVVMQQIDEAVPKIQAEAKRLIQESLSNAFSGSMPGLSGSTQTPSASGS